MILGRASEPQEIVHPGGGPALRHLAVHQVLAGRVVYGVPVDPWRRRRKRGREKERRGVRRKIEVLEFV